MKVDKIIKISIIFLIGFLSANILGLYVIYGFEVPLSLDNLSTFGFSPNNSNSAPFDFIQEKDIKIYDDKIVIGVNGASLSRYAPTGSMKPILDEGSNGIRVKPNSEQDIHIGDIISFRQDKMLIVHRVIEIGNDKQGVYFITKGDNNNLVDGKVRFENIEFITIGVIW
jgi:hypothetical protein